jgi:beta-galactosidase/beta-glucuronidase
MKRFCMLVWALICFAGLAPLSAVAHTVQIKGKSLLVDGRPFIVRGIHYGPWRPGTGPGKGFPYPSPQNVDEDFRIIRSLNANAILVYNPPGYVLDIADRYGLKVLYCFDLNWYLQTDDAAARERAGVLHAVQDNRQKPALLGWVLGNEIPLNAIEQRGASTIENSLSSLYRSVKEVDPDHPITHSNWPVAKDLNLGFFDIVSFNVYPLWPPEVVAMGYGRYIEKVLQPIAGNKPLLITEFGANSLEATEDGEGRLLLQSWKDLRKAGACGGMVFEFADEWWKNYDNPRRAGNWWDRKAAPDDEKTHDLDPEEYYGVVDAYRRPKPAFKLVQRMFAEDALRIFTIERLIPFVLVLLLLLVAGGAWLWARRRSRTQAYLEKV